MKSRNLYRYTKGIVMMVEMVIVIRIDAMHGNQHRRGSAVRPEKKKKDYDSFHIRAVLSNLVAIRNMWRKEILMWQNGFLLVNSLHFF
jgi:hypothetical protein